MWLSSWGSRQSVYNGQMLPRHVGNSELYCSHLNREFFQTFGAEERHKRFVVCWTFRPTRYVANHSEEANASFSIWECMLPVLKSESGVELLQDKGVRISNMGQIVEDWDADKHFLQVLKRLLLWYTPHILTIICKEFPQWLGYLHQIGNKPFHLVEHAEKSV